MWNLKLVLCQSGHLFRYKLHLVQLATGGSAFEEGMKGHESAAKFYDTHSSLERRGGSVAKAKRFPDASKGIEGTGPFISKQHTVHVLVCPTKHLKLCYVLRFLCFATCMVPGLVSTQFITKGKLWGSQNVFIVLEFTCEIAQGKHIS